MNKYFKALALSAVLALGFSTAACTSDADTASANLSAEAEAFKILRRVVFYNGITDSYILVVEGFCSVEVKPDNLFEVTCKTAVKGAEGAKEDEYKKHFLGRSDNVTWFAEQIDGANVSTRHYKVIFKPTSIIPDVDVK